MKALKAVAYISLNLLLVSLLSLTMIANYQELTSGPNKGLDIAVDSTVLVVSPEGNRNWYGSGVIFINNDKTFVWTCHHVIANNIKQEWVWDLSTNKITGHLVVNPVEVGSKLFNDEPREVGEMRLAAKIIRFSEADDLALLEIEHGFYKKSAHFPRRVGYTPRLGTPIYHVGCFNGPDGERSVSQGIAGVVGLDLDGDGRLYDRVGLAFQRGSSGGGVYEANTGACIGIIARLVSAYNQGNQGLIIPFRRMENFADRLDCHWALRTCHEVPENYLDSLSDDKQGIPFKLKTEIIR